MVIFAIGGAVVGVGSVLIGAAAYDDYSHSDHSDYSDAAERKRLENELKLENEKKAAQIAYDNILLLKKKLDKEYGDIIHIENYDASELNDNTIKTLNIEMRDFYKLCTNKEIEDKTKDLKKEIKDLDSAIEKLQEVQERLQAEGL